MLLSACGQLNTSPPTNKWVRLGIFGNGGGISCPSTTDCWITSTSGSLLHTTDAGASWRRVPVDTGSPVQVVSISCPTTVRCVGTGLYQSGSTESTELISSDDGGVTWFGQDSGLSGYPGEISCVNSSFCYGTALQNWFTTTNGGQSWWVSPTHDPNVLLGPMNCQSPRNCVLVGQTMPYGNTSVVWRSTDGARRFELVGKLLPSVLDPLQCFTVKTCIGQAGTLSGIQIQILITHNAGASWTVLRSIPTSYTQPTYVKTWCWSASSCLVAEAAGTLRFPFTLTTHNDFKSVTEQRLPFGTGSINQITCPSSLVCFAVGQTTDLRGEVFRLSFD